MVRCTNGRSPVRAPFRSRAFRGFHEQSFNTATDIDYVFVIGIIVVDNVFDLSYAFHDIVVIGIVYSAFYSDVDVYTHPYRHRSASTQQAPSGITAPFTSTSSFRCGSTTSYSGTAAYLVSTPIASA